MNNFLLNNNYKNKIRINYIKQKNSLVKVVHDMNLLRFQFKKSNILKSIDESIDKSLDKSLENYKRYLGKTGLVVDNIDNNIQVLFPYTDDCNDKMWFPIECLVVNDDNIKKLLIA